MLGLVTDASAIAMAHAWPQIVGMDPSAALALGDRTRAGLASLIDLQMRPLGEAAMAALGPARGDVILDIGCGAGDTILQLADHIGPRGHVIGVDIGPQVLAIARQRAGHLANVTLLQEDAAKLNLATASLDAAYSRFGTMFFSDPVAAFANLHRMLRLGGRLGFVCWRSVAENELDRLCLEAAGLPIAVDDTPYSFADADTITDILRTTGFDGVRIIPHDAQISCGGVAATLEVVTRVGALGKALRENPNRLAECEDAVRRALHERERDGVVVLGAATWIVVATS